MNLFLIDRRAFLGAFALLAAPSVAEAQPPPRLVRVGFLSASSPGTDRMWPGLVDALRQLGHAVGKTLVVE